MIRNNIVGKKFGNLTVVRMLTKNNHGEMEWLCKCDCGTDHVSTTNRLTSGKTTCCKECANRKISASNHKNGTEPIVLYRCYANMKTRCYNKNYFLYHRYGGRGISVCDEWRNDFATFRSWAFENGWNENLTLDRIDNDRDYSPTNCRWITLTEQANNRSTNRFLEYNGEKDTMANWARRLNIPYYIIQYNADIGKTLDYLVERIRNGDISRHKAEEK